MDVQQNMSSKEKTALGKLIRAKNTKIIINDMDKSMGLQMQIKKA